MAEAMIDERRSAPPGFSACRRCGCWEYDACWDDVLGAVLVGRGRPMLPLRARGGGAVSKGFAELQKRSEFALAVGDEAEARAAIRAMKEFVVRAEKDLQKLVAWKAGRS